VRVSSDKSTLTIMLTLQFAGGGYGGGFAAAATIETPGPFSVR
jgi:hypothetical protein